MSFFLYFYPPYKNDPYQYNDQHKTHHKLNETLYDDDFIFDDDDD